ncbi:MAG: class I SAM-dependent methyltransferase [Capsulimonadaceae bacterium]
MATVDDREAEYWDGVAGRITDQDLLSEDLSPTLAEQHCIDAEGDIAGLHVLDVGCGMGRGSILLAKRGAEVWAVDISPVSIGVARRRAALAGLSEKIHAEVMSAMELNFPSGFFDLVVGQDIIHHLDADKFGAEIARVMRPGARAIFRENCANNPILMFARNNLCGRFGIPKWSSDDEYPLTRAKLKQFGKYFATVTTEFPEFLFLHYVNCKFYKYRSKFMNWACRSFDDGIYRYFPFMRQYSYRQLVVCVSHAAAKESRKDTVPSACYGSSTASV